MLITIVVQAVLVEVTGAGVMVAVVTVDVEAVDVAVTRATPTPAMFSVLQMVEVESGTFKVDVALLVWVIMTVVV